MSVSPIFQKGQIMIEAGLIPSQAIVLGLLMLGLATCAGVLLTALKIWAMIRPPPPQLPCQVGTQWHTETENKLSSIDERLSGMAKRNHELRRELEDKIDKFSEKSEESDRRMNARLTDISNKLSELFGIIKERMGV